MYIAPSTDIRLLRGVPLDNRYLHSISFETVGDQTSWMIGKTKYLLSSQSYQRVETGRSRVQISADNLYDCNYMMFRNTAFGNKWFYAFITGVEYINNETSEITFEIDDLQSWLFDYEYNMCYIERSHPFPGSDTIGAFIEPEPVETGEYVFNDDYQELWPDCEELCVIVAIVDTSGGASGKLYNGIYGGATYFAYNKTDTVSINSKIDEYNKSPESILNIYMVPKVFIGEEIPSGGKQLDGTQTAGIHGFYTNKPTTLDTLDGYLPKNRKLYTYPYCFYQVDNCSGQGMALRYEFSDAETTLNLSIVGTVTQPVQMTVYPSLYKGIGGKGVANLNRYGGETLTIGNFPMCSWNVDSYQAWVAQNSLPLALDAVGSVGSSAVGFATGNPIGGAMNLLGSASSLASQFYRASIAADLCKGNSNNGSPNVAANMNQFFGGRMSVTSQYAEMIDNFFEMFGYHIGKIEYPNRNKRPHWTYIKTLGLSVSGNLPADARANICSIHDNGITWWKNGNEVGDYSLDNHTV